jgi:ABC-type phosphate transport system permease subunit
MQPQIQANMTYTGITHALSKGRIFEETLPLLVMAGGIHQCA